MPAVLGIDHIYLAVQDLERAERFYDRVMLGILGFRKSRFTLESDPHVHYFNRHFGFVLRPAAAAAAATLPGSAPPPAMIPRPRGISA